MHLQRNLRSLLDAWRFTRTGSVRSSILSVAAALSFAGCPGTDLIAQEKSVKPGINDSFKDAKVSDFVEKFEIESREVFQRREQIVAACELKPGQIIADVGAGTGLFTRMFSSVVGKEGRVIAVDITKNFLDHIARTCRELDLRNVDTQLCSVDSVQLPVNSIDVAFICDTYHHFEFPTKTATSIWQAMKPGGRLVVIDFKRVSGESTEWVMSHVRAGQEVFEQEITAVGFKRILDRKDLLKENYFLVFEKPDKSVPRN